MAGVSIVAEIWSEFMAVKGSYAALKTSSAAAFSISLFPMIGFTAVSELWISSWSIDFRGTLVCWGWTESEWDRISA